MALPPLVRQVVEKHLGRYCARRIPEEAKDHVRIAYKIRGNSVTLYEKRPSRLNPDQSTDLSVAQFRFEPESNQWKLYCSDRRSRWHEYRDLDPSRDFKVLLREVEDDPSAIFWG